MTRVPRKGFTTEALGLKMVGKLFRGRTFHMRKSAILLLFLCSSLSCGAPTSESEGARHWGDENGEGLETALRLLREEQERMKSTLLALARRQGPHAGGRVTFDPSGDQGAFQALGTELGTFTVLLRNVRPYADGVRVELEVGNLLSAAVISSYRIRWGSRQPEETSPAHREWEESLRSLEVDSPERLTAGQWNQVTFNLPDTDPAHFGYLELSMHPESVALGR